MLRGGTNETKIGLAAREDLAAKIARATAPVFAINEWAWRGTVPDEAAIASCLRGLIERVEMDRSLGTGRFRVTRYEDELGVECIDVALDVGGINTANDK